MAHKHNRRRIRPRSHPNRRFMPPGLSPSTANQPLPSIPEYSPFEEEAGPDIQLHGLSPYRNLFAAKAFAGVSNNYGDTTFLNLWTSFQPVSQYTSYSQFPRLPASAPVTPQSTINRAARITPPSSNASSPSHRFDLSRFQYLQPPTSSTTLSNSPTPIIIASQNTAEPPIVSLDQTISPASVEKNTFRLFGGEPGDDVGLCAKMLECFRGMEYLKEEGGWDVI